MPCPHRPFPPPPSFPLPRWRRREALGSLPFRCPRRNAADGPGLLRPRPSSLRSPSLLVPLALPQRDKTTGEVCTSQPSTGWPRAPSAPRTVRTPPARAHDYLVSLSPRGPGAGASARPCAARESLGRSAPPWPRARPPDPGAGAGCGLPPPLLRPRRPRPLPGWPRREGCSGAAGMPSQARPLPTAPRRGDLGNVSSVLSPDCPEEATGTLCCPLLLR